MRDNVAQISALRLRSLGAIGDSIENETNRIDALTTETRTLMQSLKARIQRLETAPIKGDVVLRNGRVSFHAINTLLVLTYMSPDQRTARQISGSYSRLSEGGTGRTGKV